MFNFNSTKVQFGGTNYIAQIRRLIISIPLRYNLESGATVGVGTEPNFNSTKVQFGADRLGLQQFRILYFNSTKVQFGGFDISRNRNEAFISIPLRYNLELQVILLKLSISGTYFNSTKVQFGDETPPPTKAAATYFNSTKVQFGGTVREREVAAS